MRRPVICLLLIALIGWAGCSSDRPSFESGPDKLGTNSDAGLQDAGCSGLVCSRDLRSVLDCDGNVVKDCAADTACGKGECVAPCDAAALNEGSVGCSFAIPGQNTNYRYPGMCAAVFVANNWTSPATPRLEFKGEERSLEGAVWVPYVEDGIVKHRKLDGPIPPGGGAVIFLTGLRPNMPSYCPEGVSPVFDKEETIPANGIGHVVFAHTDVPVSMYSIYPYGGAESYLPSATLLLPTTSFRKNYIAVSTWGGQGDNFALPTHPFETVPPEQVGKPTLQLVATEDDTAVDIVPTVDLVGGNGIPMGPRNEVTRYTLQRGEVMQLTQESELVGSVIETSKPIGLFGGASCSRVPANVQACDADNVQIPPVSAWGSEYAVLPAPNRLRWQSQSQAADQDFGIVRIVGAADGTKLFFEPSPPPGAPDTIDLGQLARFVADRPFVVRSQDAEHPFYVASLMTGSMASATLLGDPETAPAIPTAQWLDSYVFFSDFSYTHSGIFVTRRKAKGVFHDVTLDCAGPLGGWAPINADYEWTFAELSREGAPVAYPTGTCTDGAHGIRSEGPFSMTVWGLAFAASYAYPGGAGLRVITDVHVPAVVR